jgi:phosphopantetheinyl transferase
MTAATPTASATSLFLLHQQQLLSRYSLAQMHSRLTRPEQLRCLEFGLQQRRHEYICGRFVLQLALKYCCNLTPAQLQWQLGPYGKPALSSSSTAIATLPQVNLSHSHGVIAVTVSPDSAVGVDVEQIATALAATELTSCRFFSLAEQRWLTGLAATELVRHACRIWTFKEAVLKALGAGLNYPPGQIDSCLLSQAGSIELQWGGQPVTVYITQPALHNTLFADFQLTVARLTQPVNLQWIPAAVLWSEPDGADVSTVR